MLKLIRWHAVFKPLLGSFELHTTSIPLDKQKVFITKGFCSYWVWCYSTVDSTGIQTCQVFCIAAVPNVQKICMLICPQRKPNLYVYVLLYPLFIIWKYLWILFNDLHIDLVSKVTSKQDFKARYWFVFVRKNVKRHREVLLCFFSETATKFPYVTLNCVTF